MFARGELVIENRRVLDRDTVDEIFRIAQRINSEVYKPVQIYSALALLFLAVCLPMHGVAMLLRRRYTRDLSEQ